MTMETQLYDLGKRANDTEVKLGATQAQVNSLFSSIEEIKKDNDFLVKLLEEIKKDIHSICNRMIDRTTYNDLETRVKILEDSKTWFAASIATVVVMCGGAWTIITFVTPLLSHG